MNVPENLTNHLIIAMPSMEDTFFSKTVVYIYEHSDKGAMGVVINKPLEISVENLLQHLEIEISTEKINDLYVLSGGPVGPEQGFVLHDLISKSEAEEGLPVTLSASKEILRAIAAGKGPRHFLITLGYSGWEPGQLEKEIQRNDWLVAPCDVNILFNRPAHERWQAAASAIGIDINQLSRHVGHA